MKSRPHGFSLLEILVAFALLALSLGVLMQIFSGSLRNADRSQREAQATLLARSLLATAGVEERLTDGEASGTLGDMMQWTRRVSRYAADDALVPPPPAGPALLELWRVTVDVAWRADVRSDEHHYTLSTLRAQTLADLPKT